MVIYSTLARPLRSEAADGSPVFVGTNLCKFTMFLVSLVYECIYIITLLLVKADVPHISLLMEINVRS